MVPRSEGESDTDFVAFMFRGDGIACQAPDARGSIRGMPEQPARRSTLSRRGMLKGGGALAFAGLSVGALKLPFFGVDGAGQDPLKCRATDVSSSDAQPADLQLDRLPRPAQGRRLDVQAVPRGDRHRGHLQRRRERQRGVLRQGQEPARLLRADRPRHVHADRLDGRPDDRPRLDPAAGPQDGAQPAQEPHEAAPRSRLGPRRDLPRAVAERPDRHRLQRRQGRRGRAPSRSC